MEKDKALSVDESAALQKQAEARKKIMAFEELVGAQEGAFFGDTANCPLTHRFAEGVYVREIFIPKGMTIVGKIHKETHPVFLMSGTIELFTEDGFERLTGPRVMISHAGAKRAARAITDVVWVTVHHNPTNTQVLEELEKIVISDSYEEYDKYIESKTNKV